MAQHPSRQFVAFDLETTGLRPDSDRVVEVGAVRFDECGQELGRFERLVNPEVLDVPGRPGRARALPGRPRRRTPCRRGSPRLPRIPRGTESNDAPRPQRHLRRRVSRPRTDKRGPPPPRFTRWSTRWPWPGPSGPIFPTTGSTPWRWPSASTRPAPTVRSRTAGTSWASGLRSGARRSPPRGSSPTRSTTRAVPLWSRSGGIPWSKPSQRAEPCVWSIKGGVAAAALRDITPRGFVHRGGVAYLVAYCHHDSFEKSFRLDRVRRYEVVF